MEIGKMKFLILIFNVAYFGTIMAAEEIPLRSPKPGESRPSWWLSCWRDHVIVIEGKISVVEDGAPDVTVTIDPDVARTFFDEKSQRLQISFSKYYLARLKPKRLLYASPGITASDGNILGVQTGKTDECVFLLPLLDRHGKFTTVMGGRNGDEGVFIFRYGSMLASVPLIFVERIPEDGLKSVQSIFAHRTSLESNNTD